jgi:His-Xaa-Ser system radical SAM maturase HxsC
MRQVPLQCHGFDDTGHPAQPAGIRLIACVTPADGLASLWQPDLLHLVPVLSNDDWASVKALQRAGVANLIPVSPNVESLVQGRMALADPDVFMTGDVVALEPARRHAEVLMRATDQHHTMFLTNRCNSRCVMCSQPPTETNDDWRVQEALDVLRHMSWSPAVIGFTGGEPLLLGEKLRTVLMATAHKHANSQIEVLTNARLAANDAHARLLFADLPSRFCWMVPLYGHAPFLHDYVVQAEGAFDETLRGLLNLQRHQQPVQLRIVLIRPVLEILPALADFIARNLPFVREVALMACEPIGFALANRADCEVDLLDWQDELQAAVRRLDRGAVPVILMNTPLCGLRPELWTYAHRSISDWKKTYAPECAPCAVKDECCGLFAWHERGWKPTVIRAVTPINQLQETTQ